MKRIARMFVYNIAGIYIASQIASGLKFNNYAEGVIITGFALGLASFTIKPAVKILLLPLTLATMGLFSFIANVITLYIIDLALNDFSVEFFKFEGLKSSYLDLPTLNYTGVMAYVAFAILISFFVSLFNWIRK